MHITLRANEKIFINGAVLKVDRKTSIELMNDAVFLLEAHVMLERDATTPLRQLYYIVQLMLMEPGERAENRAMLAQHVGAMGRVYEDAEILNGLVRVTEHSAARARSKPSRRSVPCCRSRPGSPAAPEMPPCGRRAPRSRSPPCSPSRPRCWPRPAEGSCGNEGSASMRHGPPMRSEAHRPADALAPRGRATGTGSRAPGRASVPPQRR